MATPHIRLAFNEDGRLLVFTPFDKNFIAMVKSLYPKPMWHPEPIRAWSVMPHQEIALRDYISMCYGAAVCDTKIDTTIVITAPKIAAPAPGVATYNKDAFDKMFGVPPTLSQQFNSVGSSAVLAAAYTPHKVIENMNDEQLTKLLRMMLSSLNTHELADLLKESVKMEVLMAMATELGLRTKPKRIIG